MTEKKIKKEILPSNDWFDKHVEVIGDNKELNSKVKNQLEKVTKKFFKKLQEKNE